MISVSLNYPFPKIFSSFVLISYFHLPELSQKPLFWSLWFWLTLSPVFLLKPRAGLDSNLLINFQCLFCNALIGKIIQNLTWMFSFQSYLSLLSPNFTPVSPGKWLPPNKAPTCCQSSVLLLKLVSLPQLVLFNMTAVKSKLIKIT